MIFKAYKYRIYPNSYQKETIDKTISACRVVYNLALETKVYAYKSHGVNIGKHELMRQLTELKKDCSWLCEVDSQALQRTIKHLDKAFLSFYNGSRFPKFRSKRNSGSFESKNNSTRIYWDRSTISLPKIFHIPIQLSQKFEGKIISITVRKTATGKYFSSILVELDKNPSTPKKVHTQTTIGLDLGIKSFAVSSNGKFFEPNRKLKDSLKRLQCLQRRASRKKKGSNNRIKANKCVAILHEKINNQRTDHIHKVTTGLIRDSQAETFVIENLNVAGMLKNRKLSQAISDVGWAEFRRQMQYKCLWYGKNLVVIDRFEPTSKKCSACGEVNQELTLADREWTCKCGVTHDRDQNAAINIKNAGLKKYSGAGSSGGPVESRRNRRSKKQESFLNN